MTVISLWFDVVRGTTKLANVKDYVRALATSSIGVNERREKGKSPKRDDEKPTTSLVVLP